MEHSIFAEAHLFVDMVSALTQKGYLNNVYHNGIVYVLMINGMSLDSRMGIC